MLSFSFRGARRTATFIAATLSALALSNSPALASTTYGCTGSTQDVTVPADALSATINLQGAAGQSNQFGVSGGAGESVNLTLPVTPGHTLTFQVGCQNNTYGGGGPTWYGAPVGGGATSLSDNGQLYGVAGGGGGAGGQDGVGTYYAGATYGGGGAGGDADSVYGGGNGTPGTPDPDQYAGGGGQSGATGGQGGPRGYNANIYHGGTTTNGANGSRLQGGSGG